MTKPLIQTTGRRKQAVARVRLRPGTGTITSTGGPSRTTSRGHPPHGRRPSRCGSRAPKRSTTSTPRSTAAASAARPAPCAWASPGPCVELDPEMRPHAEEGRPPHPRRPREGEQEVRPQEGPQGAAVLQALIRAGPSMALRFGTDGVRGVANTELTPELALALGRAAARVLGGDRVVIGRDTRRSGPDARGRARRRLRRRGRRRRAARRGADARPSPTSPTPSARAGAVISASHNPFADNGIKLFAPGGRKLPDDVEEAHRGRARARSWPASVGEPAAGDGRRHASATPTDAGRALRRPPRRRCSRRPARSTGLRRRPRLRQRGRRARWRRRSSTASGRDVVVRQRRARRLQHQRSAAAPPIPTTLRPRRGGRWVPTLGLAFDGDGDRLIAVDHTGAVVDGDHIIAICALDLHAPRPAPRRHRGRHRDDQPRLPPGHGAGRHPRRRDGRRRPLRARGARGRAASRSAASRAAT